MKTKQIWQQIAQLKSFSVVQVAALTQIDARQVSNAFTRWKKLGHIKQVNHQQRYKTYKVVSDNPPRFGQGNHSSKQHKKINSRQHIWNTLKIMQRVFIFDVLMVTDCGKSSARDYLNALERCGYVKGFYPVNKPKSWLFINNTGRLAPAHIRGVGVYDKNLDQLVEYSRPPKSQNKTTKTDNCNIGIVENR